MSISRWSKVLLASILRPRGTRVIGLPIRTEGDMATIGGVQAVRGREGLRWHRLVDAESAEDYARSHGRTRDRAERITGRVVLCGQKIMEPIRGTVLTAEVRLFEDRPPADESCGKCWGG